MNVDIGIKREERQSMAEKLNALLADTYVLYVKTQNYHWNVTGKFFFEYHKIFENQYQELALFNDILAERIRSLGYRVPGSMLDFLRITNIEEDNLEDQFFSGEYMAESLERDHELLAKEIRSVLKEFKELADEGSVDLLINQLRFHEKVAWMLRSVIEPPKEIVFTEREIAVS